jgi:RNA recognition motif-containing protein
MLRGDRGKFTGRAIVNFETEEAAKSALELNGSEMEGKKIVVDFFVSKPKPEGCTAIHLGKQNFFGTTPSHFFFPAGLHVHTTEDDLLNYFSEFGEVTSVVLLDKSRGRFQGHGMVYFKDTDSTDKVIELSEEGEGVWVGKAQNEIQVKYAHADLAEANKDAGKQSAPKPKLSPKPPGCTTIFVGMCHELCPLLTKFKVICHS